MCLWHEDCTRTSVALLPRDKLVSQVDSRPITASMPSGKMPSKVANKPQSNTKGIILNFDRILNKDLNTQAPQPARVSLQDDRPEVVPAQGSVQVRTKVDLTSCQIRQAGRDRCSKGSRQPQAHDKPLMATTQINTAGQLQANDGSKDQPSTGSEQAPCLQDKTGLPPYETRPHSLPEGHPKAQRQHTTTRPKVTTVADTGPNEPLAVTGIAIPVHPDQTSQDNDRQTASQGSSSWASPGKPIIDPHILPPVLPGPDRKIHRIGGLTSYSVPPNRRSNVLDQDQFDAEPDKTDSTDNPSLDPPMRNLASSLRPLDPVQGLIYRLVQDQDGILTGSHARPQLLQPKTIGQASTPNIQSDTLASSQEAIKDSKGSLAGIIKDSTEGGPEDIPISISQPSTAQFQQGPSEVIHAQYMALDLAIGPDRPLAQPTQPDVKAPDMPDIWGLQQQLIERMRVALDQGQRSITVELHPPELGWMAITFEHSEDALIGRLEVSNRQTYLGLEQSAKDITANLQAQGIQVKQLDIALVSEDLPYSGYDHDHNQDNPHHPWRDQAYTGQTDQPALTAVAHPPAQPGVHLGPDGSIDMLA